MGYHEDDSGYDDYDSVAGLNRLSNKPQRLAAKVGQWQCSICTYANDGDSASCSTCGILRELFADFINVTEKEVQSRCMDSEPSIMAKSLFTRSPVEMLKEPMVSEFRRIPEIHEQYVHAFSALQETFISCNGRHSISIVPFKFDTPSPDDVVSTGLKSSNVSKVLVSSSSMSVDINMKKDVGSLNDKIDISSAFLSKSINEDSSDSMNATQIVSGILSDLSLDKKKIRVQGRKINEKLSYKPEKWMLSDERQETLRQLSIAVVGHVDSGKSTLCGKLLHALGKISKKQMHKYEKEAEDKGKKSSFAYAWAMDETSDERTRGITMNVAVAYFESENYRVVLLDSPGHRDFVPNVISGAAQADAAVLVVDASVGSFEAGMGGIRTGQTKEHAQLIRSFGVEQIIVAVNKMDMMDFAKERFDFIKSQLGLFLHSCGFKESSIEWIPLSAIENENLTKRASNILLTSWYSGCSLLDAIDALRPAYRDLTKPLVLPICDIISSHTLGQVAVSGKLETGAIKIGSKVLVMPFGLLATVRAIERDSSNCNTAKAGDNVLVGLQGIDVVSLMRGGVLCHPDFPVQVASKMELKILVLDVSSPVVVGLQVELHIHHAKLAAGIGKIISCIDQKTGEATKRSPRMLTARQSAIIEVELDGEVCVQEFSICRALGRVFLRASGNTIAVGIVARVL